MSATARSSAMVIRQATAADVPAAAQICFEAFHRINTEHNFPPDIPNVEIANGFMAILFSHPGFYCVVAEENGRVVGSNCMDERSPIYGIGPITIDPAAQNRGVGRALMQAVMDRADERNAPGVRLVQAAFHSRSMSLYTKLGFAIREPLVSVVGPKIGVRIDGCYVREATMDDVSRCNELAVRVHGHHRGGELIDNIQQKLAVVVERHGRITGYASAMNFFGHAVGESNVDLFALLGDAASIDPPGILIPSRNGDLFRWCLDHGLRVTQPMSLMTTGLYSEPNGAYFASVMY